MPKPPNSKSSTQPTPSKPPSEEQVEKQLLKGVLEAIEIVEARIRYNEAFLTFLNHADDEQVLAQCRRFVEPEMMIQPLLRKISASEIQRDYAQSDVNAMRNKYEYSASCDLEKLRKILAPLKASLTDKKHILTVVALTQVMIGDEKMMGTRDIKVYDDLQRLCLSKIAKIRKKLKKSSSTKDGADLGQAQINLDLANKARAKFLGIVSDRCESPALEKVNEILDGCGAISKLERDYLNKHVKIEIVHDQLASGFTDAYNRLKEQNYRILHDLFTEVNSEFAKLSTTSADLVNPFFEIVLQNLVFGLEDDLNENRQKATSHDEFLAHYRFEHKFAVTVQKVRAKVFAALEQEKAWKAEQDRILAAQKYAEEQRLAVLAKTAAEEKARLAAELRAQAEREKIARNERKAQHKLELQRQREGKEQAKEQKTREKKLRKQQEVKDSIRVQYDDQTKKIVGSAFIVGLDVIAKHREELRNLFVHSTKAYRYRDAVTLINSLGGTLDKSSGSSHQTIRFNGALYQEVDFSEEEDVSATTTKPKVAGGIFRPHSGETELRNFNLTLFRDAICSVLPENWDAAPRTESTLTHRTSLFRGQNC